MKRLALSVLAAAALTTGCSKNESQHAHPPIHTGVPTAPATPGFNPEHVNSPEAQQEQALRTIESFKVEIPDDTLRAQIPSTASNPVQFKDFQGEVNDFGYRPTPLPEENTRLTSSYDGTFQMFEEELGRLDSERDYSWIKPEDRQSAKVSIQRASKELKTAEYKKLSDTLDAIDKRLKVVEAYLFKSPPELVEDGLQIHVEHCSGECVEMTHISVYDPKQKKRTTIGFTVDDGGGYVRGLETIHEVNEESGNFSFNLQMQRNPADLIGNIAKYQALADKTLAALEKLPTAPQYFVVKDNPDVRGNMGLNVRANGAGSDRLGVVLPGTLVERKMPSQSGKYDLVTWCTDSECGSGTVSRDYLEAYVEGTEASPEYRSYKVRVRNIPMLREGLRFRSTSSRIEMGRLSIGEEVEVIGESQEGTDLWLLVKTNDGRRGYLAAYHNGARYLDRVSE